MLLLNRSFFARPSRAFLAQNLQGQRVFKDYRAIAQPMRRAPDRHSLCGPTAAAVNHATVSAFIKQQMASGVLRNDDPHEAGRMLLDLCTAGYHDLVLYGVEPVSRSAEKRQAARVVKQFLRCYGPGDV